MDRIKILLAEDHVLLRETMKPLLNAQPDLEVVAEAGTAAGALEQAEALKPDVILLDITLPDRSGISLLPELRQRFPTSRVVALTMHNEPEFMRSAFAAGAAGYVLKSSVPEVLLEAIRAVYRGEEFENGRNLSQQADQETRLHESGRPDEIRDRNRHPGRSAK
ncbi:MAG: response regulator transcription factor [Planctomycetes bacterium]|nr:response regulator transcription factor [Planctomycetota bacterium]